MNHRLRPLRSPAGPVTGQLDADRDGCGHASLETEEYREMAYVSRCQNGCRRDLVFRLVRFFNKERERQRLIISTCVATRKVGVAELKDGGASATPNV